MRAPIIDDVEIFQVRASIRSIWLFVLVTLETGQFGLGEATLDGHMDDVERELHRLGGRVIGKEASETRIVGGEDLVMAAAVSALNQAICDACAQADTVAAAAWLGNELRRDIKLYANINRRTTVRTPEGFKDSARHAFNAGFRAFKIAPFDEVVAGSRLSSASLSAGLQRIEAVRTQIGDNCRLMVDCHWRFDINGAASLIDACADYHLHWVECPLPETADTLRDIAKVRRLAARRGMLLAGGEDVVGLGGVQPYLDHDCYDVIMPDVKYVGGPLEMLRVAERLEEAGVEFSPHNPSGPVSHAASLEVCAAAGKVGLLECQYGETPIFAALLEGGGQLTADIALKEERVGFGITLKADVLAQHRLTLSKAMEDNAYEKDVSQ